MPIQNFGSFFTKAKLAFRAFWCRAKPQIAALLLLTQMSADSAFQQLPAISTVFLAEAATVLQNPQATLYPATTKLLVRVPKLDLQVLNTSLRLCLIPKVSHIAYTCFKVVLSHVVNIMQVQKQQLDQNSSKKSRDFLNVLHEKLSKQLIFTYL